MWAEKQQNHKYRGDILGNNSTCEKDSGKLGRSKSESEPTV